MGAVSGNEKRAFCHLALATVSSWSRPSSVNSRTAWVRVLIPTPSAARLSTLSKTHADTPV